MLTIKQTLRRIATAFNFKALFEFPSVVEQTIRLQEEFLDSEKSSWAGSRPIKTTRGFAPLFRDHLLTDKRFHGLIYTDRPDETRVLRRGTSARELRNAYQLAGTTCQSWPGIDAPAGSDELIQQAQRNGFISVGIPTTTSQDIAAAYARSGFIRYFNMTTFLPKSLIRLELLLCEKEGITLEQLRAQRDYKSKVRYPEEKEVTIRAAVPKFADMGFGTAWQYLEIINSEHICGETVLKSGNLALIHSFGRLWEFFESNVGFEIYKISKGEAGDALILAEYRELYEGCSRLYIDYMDSLKKHSEEERVAMHMHRSTLQARIQNMFSQSHVRQFSTFSQGHSSSNIFHRPDPRKEKQATVEHQMQKTEKIGRRQKRLRG